MISIDIIVRACVRACVCMCVKFEIIYNYLLLYHFALQHKLLFIKK